WLTLIGFHMTFLVQHWLGNAGMPRRYADYLPTDGFTTLNTISTIGSFILGASMLPFLWNVWKSYKTGPVVTVDDPWGYGNSLEWATTSPPPLRNFHRLPRIRSERPAFDLKFPDLATGTPLAAPPKPRRAVEDGAESESDLSEEQR
ncbi:MAG TPA: cbb3-type cytochrome c oxidase subunit I, partial [Micromonosporaceae bacterium]